MKELKIELSDKVGIHAKYKDIGSPVCLIVTHGIGEHLERHNYINQLFSDQFNIFQYDLRGHGRSGGRRGYINNFETYMLDMAEILEYLRAELKVEKFILFGHSMGALITAGYLQKYSRDDYYPEQVFLNAPPVGIPGILGKIVKCLPLGLISAIPLSIKIGGTVDLALLSHDKSVKENYIKDEYNLLKLHTKLLVGMMAASKMVFTAPLNAKCPVICTVGGDDRIVCAKSVKNYFDKFGGDAVFRIIDGAWHEIHNEIDEYRIPYFQLMKENIGVITS